MISIKNFSIILFLLNIIHCGETRNTPYQNPKELPHLIDSSIKGDLAEVQSILKEYKNINVQDHEGKSSLIHVSIKGHVSVAKFLIDEKANINLKDNNGKTALMEASSRGHVDIVKLLYPKSNPNLKDRDGKTALIWAAEKGQLKVIEILLDKKPLSNYLFFNFSPNTEIDSRDSQGVTALMTAVIKGHTDIVRYLLSKNADINAKDQDGKTALMKAAEITNPLMAKILIENQANVNLKDVYGNTALMKAISKNNTEIVKLLLNNKSDVNAKGYNNMTALMNAAGIGNKEIIMLLLNYKANINDRDDNYKTALEWASSKEVKKILEEYKVSYTDEIVNDDDIDNNIPKTNKNSKDSYALIIGNEDYSSIDKSTNVKGAIKDAETFSKYLENVIGIRHENIVVKQNVTKKEFYSSLEKVFSNAKYSLKDQRAYLYFYFAGHGLPGNKDSFIIPSGIKKDELKNLPDYAISLSELYTQIKKHNFTKSFVFLDSCYSGRDGALTETRDLVIEEKEPELPKDILIFSAAQSNEKAYLKKNSEHGQFTYFLLKKIKETKGNIKYSDLCRDVEREVYSNSAKEHDSYQTPGCKFNEEDFKDWGFVHEN